MEETRALGTPVAEDMGRIQDGNYEASLRGSGCHDDRNSQAQVRGDELVAGNQRSHKVPFAAVRGPLYSDSGTVGRHEERGSREEQQQHSERNGGHTAVLGFGRSPTAHRGSPHFPTPTVAVDAVLVEAGCADGLV